MYTVVVCSDCKYVWIVENRPDTSQCRRCRKRRKFAVLKKYYRTDDLEAATLARAHTQAKVNNQEERFAKEIESGALEIEIDEAVPNSDFLDQKGIDSQAISKEVENILHKKNRIPTSKSEIVEQALSRQDATTLEEFLETATGYGLTKEESLNQLKKRYQSGVITDHAEITIGEIEEAIEEVTSSQSKPNRPTNSIKKTIYAGLSDLDAPMESDLIEYSVEEGFDKQKVELYLSKMVDFGEVTRDKDGRLRRVH